MSEQRGGPPRLCANCHERAFAQRVLDGDSYGCEASPTRCLHSEARRQLDRLDARFDFTASEDT